MNPYVNLARQTITDYLTKQDLPEIKTADPKLLTHRGGCFVSFHTKGTNELRGCIGTILPTYKNLAAEIIGNTIEASRDPRFDSIAKEELNNLEINVDVLSTPEAINSRNFLNPKKYGVIVKTEDGREGLLLPDLEGVDSADQQIDIAKQKAGILPDEKVLLYRFTVDRYTES